MTMSSSSSLVEEPEEQEELLNELSDEDVTRKKKKRRKNEFIDDEAELSGDDEVSEDEADNSDEDDLADLDLVDKDAPELDSDQEEEVRGLYHKQLETEDKRALLLLQEQLEEKDVAIGERRRRKFRWQTKELMENSLRRHYDPDDDDSQDYTDDEEDEVDYSTMRIGLKRPTAESLLIGSTKVTTTKIQQNSDTTVDFDSTSNGKVVLSNNEDSNGTMSSRLAVRSTTTTTATASDMNRFVFRDREIVEALSAHTKEVVVTSREDRDRNVQREIKRVLQSKSIFDQLYS